MTDCTTTTKEPELKDLSLKDKQEARSFLRERFLRVVTGLTGQLAEFEMHDNTSVSAQFQCCDIDVQTIAVSNLKTPLGVIPHGVLRSNDVYTIKFPELNNLC